MIDNVTYIKDYILKVTFKDRTIQIIDVFPIMSESTHPLIKKYIDKELFKTFYVDAQTGALCWGDNEFDLNPHTIYKGIYNVKHPKE